LDLDVQCLVGMGIGGDVDIGAGGSEVRWRRRWSLMHAVWISPHPERGEA
jgi:hypothetical protein